jgi:hypothetical protein
MSVSDPRELRSIVWIEVVAVIAIAIAPLPELMPAVLPLLVVATASRYLRRRSWAEVVVRGSAYHAAIGVLVGAVALGLAVIVATRGMSALSQRSFEWSEHAVVRGNLELVFLVGIYVAVAALAAELALRGWIVERVLELSPGSPVLPVFAGAFAEAMIMPGDLATRIGAALFGAGLGWMYVAGGRSVVAPICARIVFQVGAVVLEALRLVD